MRDSHNELIFSVASIWEIVINVQKGLLDSIDPDYVKKIRALGGTGATSNPIIIADLIKTGRFDDLLTGFLEKGMKDEEIAWATTDHLVKQAQAVFLPAWEQARGDD